MSPASKISNLLLPAILACCSSCSMLQSISGNKPAAAGEHWEQNLVLHIRRDPGLPFPVVRMISSTARPGSSKERRKPSVLAGNYLTLYLYRFQTLTDSLRIAHPLYRYVTSRGTDRLVAAKDSVLPEGEFVVRFRTADPATEIGIRETQRSSGTGPLTILKIE